MADTAIDTSQALEIAYSPLKLVLAAMGCAGFVIAGFWMIGLDAVKGRYSIETAHLVGYLSILFFGAILLLVVWRLITRKGAVLTLSPEGLRDMRVSHDVIPWPAIARISTWQSHGQRIMVLGLHPGEEAKLRLTRLARVTRGANAKLGADGLSIAAQGTAIKHDDLMAATIAYAQRYGNG